MFRVSEYLRILWVCGVTMHTISSGIFWQMGRIKRIWYLLPMRAAKVQASLRIRAVSPEPPLLAHTDSESRGTFRQKARSLAPLNDWACAVEICHDGMLEDTNSLDGAQMSLFTKVLTCMYLSTERSAIGQVWNILHDKGRPQLWETSLREPPLIIIILKQLRPLPPLSYLWLFIAMNTVLDTAASYLSGLDH